MMELKSLKSFISVATLKSFSGAARELNTVQPAISRHISALEEELETVLFIRNTREVTITPAGVQLLNDAKRLLSQAEQAKVRTKKAAAGELGVLRVGYLPSACLTFIPTLVQRFHERYPQVEISLFEMTASEQIQAFDRDEIEVGISRPLPEEKQKSFTSELLYTDYLSLVVPDQHPLAARKQADLTQIKEANIIVFHREEALGLFDSIINLCQKHQISPHITAQPRHMQTLLTMVAAGLGVAIAPKCTAKLFTQGCRFVAIKNDDTEVLTQIHCKLGDYSPTAKAFMDIALGEADSIQREMDLGEQ